MIAMTERRHRWRPEARCRVERAKDTLLVLENDDDVIGCLFHTVPGSAVPHLLGDGKSRIVRD